MIIDEANDKKFAPKKEWKRQNSRAILTKEERTFLEQGGIHQYGDFDRKAQMNYPWNMIYDIKFKSTKAFEKDLPLIMENADWIFADKPLESLKGIEKVLFEDIKTLYFIHYQAILKERKEANLKSTVAQRVIWERVTHTISEVKREVHEHFKQLENNQHNKQEYS